MKIELSSPSAALPQWHPALGRGLLSAAIAGALLAASAPALAQAGPGSVPGHAAAAEDAMSGQVAAADARVVEVEVEVEDEHEDDAAPLPIVVQSVEIGDGAVGTGAHAVAVGDGAAATGDASTVVGGRAAQFNTVVISDSPLLDENGDPILFEASASGQHASGFGAGSRADGDFSTAIGANARADAHATALGFHATAATRAIAVGDYAQAVGENSIALGGSYPTELILTTPDGDVIVDIVTPTQATGSHAMAIGSGAYAANDYGISLGVAANSGVQAVAIGVQAQGNGSNGVSIGTLSNSYGEQSISVGTESLALATDAVAVGTGALALSEASIAVGPGAFVEGVGSVAIGQRSYAGRDNVISVGDVEYGITRQIVSVAAGTEKTDAVNLEQLQAATGSTRYFAGTGRVDDAQSAGAYADGEEATAAGETAMAVGNGASAFGAGAVAYADRAIALGHNALAAVDEAMAVGAGAQANAAQAVALGASSLAEGDAAVAIGAGANARATDSVAIGAGSVADRAGTVSFGSAGAERRLTNVAAGVEDTDAVNLAQLNALASGVGELAQDAVIYDAGDKTRITFAGAGGTRLDNVADGLLAADSLQAVNGGQLSRSLDSVAGAFGAGARVAADGQITGLRLEVGGAAFGSVGAAFAAVDLGLQEIGLRLERLEAGQNHGGLVAIGDGGRPDDHASVAPGSNGVAVGVGAQTGADNGVAIGAGASAAEIDATAVGAGASVAGQDGTAVGAGSRIDAGAGHAVALGESASVQTEGGTALGQGAQVVAEGAVALGQGAVADRADTVSVGRAGGERQIANVAAGTQDTDAVNLAQMRAGDRDVLAAANAYTDTRIDEWSQAFEQHARRIDERFAQMDRQIARMGAMSGAYAGMAMNASGLEGRNRVGVGVGAQGGENALAIGYQRAFGRRASISVGGATAGGQTSVSAGAGFSW